MKALTKKANSKTQVSTSKEDKFISKILENLDKVNAKDWEQYANVPFQHPKNLFTKKEYQGFNIFALYIDMLVNKFKTSCYATFRSISKAGGKLKKGAKGTVIEFFSYVFKHKETGQIFTSEQFSTMSSAERENLTKIICIRNYTVFNSELIENLEEININIDPEDENHELDFQEQINCENFITKLITSGNLKLTHARLNVACYAPIQDYIAIPEKKFFISEDRYYATLFHEIIHWTGHESRLNRNLKGHYDVTSYSFEELIAEMGSMLICLQFGITSEFINSVRYLKSWSVNNSENRTENIKKAFVLSKKAKKYLEQF
ncbi:zincin-like metallopeptidase domain-containing protein [Chryseobacterium rhizosphaerae]|uniref:zincin-like metallopeptidase domain-containing protein n=1 Tax=Chryseobacterium rhizosphaerae TaxID=395937 RepID=UPI0023583A3C|nr:zincin-like metallopeptidase domain-containing protein [Chryseobacterium rhizosphaerae]MDC8102686.1 zincin-like metallopeptidase domain-containing protein [Chryseobacterium rhizosphaerae]